MKNNRIPLPTLGQDMLSEQTSLPSGAVRIARNVDIGRDGTFGRRAGFVERVAGDAFHSIYYAAQKGWLLVCQGRTLYRMNPDTLALTSLFTLNSEDPLSYTEFNGEIYFTNPSTIGWIPSDSVLARTAGVVVPPAPVATATTIGGLVAGEYGVSITLVDDRGEESGASEATTVVLPVPGGILLSGLPVISNHRVYVYVTPPDGDQLYFTTDFVADAATAVISISPGGATIDTQFLRPMLPGQFVRGFNGRLYTGYRDRLAFSEPFRPRACSLRHGWIAMSGYISFVEPVVDGIYVGDSRGVWFMAGGDPSKFEPRLVSKCRAVRRSSTLVPGEHFPDKAVQGAELVAVWLSTSGYVLGLPGGTTVELHPDRVKLAAGMTGTSTFLLRSGRKQLISLVDSTSTAPGLAPDSPL